MDKEHSLIRHHFNISKNRSKLDNLPHAAKHGGRDRLGEVFRDLGLNKGAEIGVKKGDYSLVLCQSNPNIELYCIDVWEIDIGDRYTLRRGRYKKIAENVLKPYNATLIQSFSMDALQHFDDESLDFVYIDAAHDFDNACMDIICWSKKVRSGGMVGCHDYYYHWNAGVVRAVDAYTMSHNIRPWYVTYELMPTAFWVKP